MSDGLLVVEVNANDVQKATDNEQRKIDGKAFLLIHQCVDSKVFENIIEEETYKRMRDKLKNLYGRDEKLKKVKLQTLTKQFEITQMKEGDLVANFFSRLVSLMNQMKACGESINDLHKIKKRLRSLTANIDYIVVFIEESKNHV